MASRTATALARITHAAKGSGISLLGRVLEGAQRAADEVTVRLLGHDFEERFRMLADRYEQLGGDPFGFNPEAVRSAALASAFFHRAYFRTDVYDVDRVPEGRVMLVANHSGQIPIDAAIIGCSLFFDANPPRITRAMVDKWTATLPFVSTFFSRMGQVVGLPENARRLLDMGELLLVFPEGMRGVSKPFNERYQLQEFGRGFMRLALETKTPIVPVGVIGAEEQYLSLGRVSWAARAFGLPVFPFIPQLLLPGGQLPLPTKYRLFFGEPMYFEGDPDDAGFVADQVHLVRESIAHILRRGLAQRRSIFV
jgi:1-acyl-sn-glycerol-3-phosphate acyltransferase